MVVATVFAMVSTGCGAPKYHYLKSTADHTFVRVPSNWTIFNEDDLLQTSDKSDEAKNAFKGRSWSVAFDASPKPSIDHILGKSGHPSGLVQVRTLSESERDAFSLADLRSLLLPWDPLSSAPQDAGQVEVLNAKEVRRPGGLHGSELLLNLKGTAGPPLKWHQIALTDATVSKVHVLVISCDDTCYTANEGVINTIIDSWKVTER